MKDALIIKAEIEMRDKHGVNRSNYNRTWQADDPSLIRAS